MLVTLIAYAFKVNRAGNVARMEKGNRGEGTDERLLSNWFVDNAGLVTDLCKNNDEQQTRYLGPETSTNNK